MPVETRQTRLRAVHCARALAVALLAATSSAPWAATVATNLGPAPAWATAMPEGTWTTINKNKVSDVDPANDSSANPAFPGTPPWYGTTGQQSVTLAWSGGALATGYGAKGSLILWGGGHQNYYGNEVYAFDLATQTWSRLTKPYTSISFPVTNGIWSDGTPSVPHTYSYSGYHPGTNSFASMLTQTSNSPANATIPVFFDLNSKTWRHAPRAPQDIQYGGWAAYDASRDAWWMEGGDSGGNFLEYAMNGDGTAGTWKSWPFKFNALDGRAGRDPAHDILVITTFRQNSNMYGLDLTNPGGATVQLNQGGSRPSTSGAAGWEWSDQLGAFIYWASGSGVYQVKLSGTDWKTGTWMWTNLTQSSNTVTPQDPSSGVYNRFRLVHYSDVDVAVMVNDTQGPVYAFRLPNGVYPEPPTAVSVQ